jgi:flagellar hook-associated protein 2
MSTQSIGSGGASGAPVTFTGLASGLNTNEIINALLSGERQQITQLGLEQGGLEAQRQALQSIQSGLQQLGTAVSELASPLLFTTSQTVSSSEPSRVGAVVTGGAGVGGYQVAVTQLANSAQRTFTFTSPAAADTITIDGHAFELSAGASIKELVEKVNSESAATVYAAAIDEKTIVFSNRETGKTEGGFIKVSDPGGALAEQAALAKEGKNAEYTIEGVAGTSGSNTLTKAIAGVTLTLNALTTTSGPITIDVAAPAASTSAIAAQVQSFAKLYNSTISTINSELSAKPPANPRNAAELATGTLFGDSDLTNLLSSLRQSIYTPIEGLPAGMSSLADIGVTAGEPTAGGLSKEVLEGHLAIDTVKLESAIKTNPAGVRKVLEGWATGFQAQLKAEIQPGGTLETRINGDNTQAAELTAHMTLMQEMLEVRQRSLREQFTALEGVMAQNQAQSSWLASQMNAMNVAALSNSGTGSSGKG